MQVQTVAGMRLRSVQQARLSAIGLGIEPGCAANLDRLVTYGVDQLNVQQASTGQIELAATNLGRLVEVMAEEARAQGESALHEWTLERAKARLCPLFPFC